MSRILVIIAVAHAAMAQVPFLGNCPNLGVMRDFNLDKVSMKNDSMSIEGIMANAR